MRSPRTLRPRSAPSSPTESGEGFVLDPGSAGTWAVFVLALGVALLLVGACASGDTSATSTTGSGDPAPFGTESVEVTQTAAGTAGRELCLLVADTPELRRVGLSGRDGLDGFDGMLFVFPDVGEHTFWMQDTHFPLDLVPLDSGGHVIDVIAMEPCREGADCPTYAPESPYGEALELPQGGLADWGFDPDASSIEVTKTGKPCEAGTSG